jgi:uncharacterized membrane-anchored protein YhcB (DUF1043 family)
MQRWHRILIALGVGLVMGLMWYTDDPDTGHHGGSGTMSLVVGTIMAVVALRLLKRLSDIKKEG